MNSISKKNYRQYSQVSRYATFPYYYHELDDAYFYGLTNQLEIDNTDFILHKVEQRDSLDSLALLYYGRPDLYWIIADFNRIADPFIKLYTMFDTIKIPSYGDIHFKEK